MKFFRALLLVLILSSPFAISSVASAEIQSLAVMSLLSEHCKGTREIFFQSHKLTSPSRKQTYYFDIVLRRVSAVSNSIELGNGSSICDPTIGLQTPTINLVSSDGDSIDLSLKGNGYYMVPEPISFSSDEKYLIVNANYQYGNHQNLTVLIINLDTGKIVPSDTDLKYCSRPSGQGVVDFMEFKGFVAPEKFIVDCQELGDTPGWSELVDLSSGNSIRTSQTSSDSLLKYGNATSSETITKIQNF